jgi:dipeptidyl aminopeptidase/acylaminoacyl peptidase
MPPLAVAALCLAPPAPLPVADLLAAREFGVRCPAELSPDGARVAYTLAVPDRRRSTRDPRRLVFAATGAAQETAGCDVWVADVATGRAANLTGGVGQSWGGVWSPDGSRLAFYSDRDGAARVWVWAAATGELTRATEAVVRPVFGHDMPAWTPDGRGLVVKVVPEGETVETLADRAHGPRPPADRPAGEAVTTQVFRSPADAKATPSTGWYDNYRCDLAVLDLPTGGVRRVARGVRVISFWLSPAGDAVAFADVRELPGPAERSLGYDLRVVPLAVGPVRTLATGVPTNMGRNVSWSPDGSRLAYQAGGLARGTGDCFVVPAAGGEPVPVTPAPHPNFDSGYRPPLWAADGKTVYLVGGGQVWAAEVAARTVAPLTKLAGKRAVTLVEDAGRVWSPDGGKSAVVLVRDDRTRAMGWHRLDLRTSETTPLWEDERAVAGGFRLSGRVTPAGPRLVFAAEGAADPPDLYQLAFDGRPPRRVTTTNPQLAGRAFGASRLVRWKSASGEELAGTLILPPGHKSGDRPTLVVRVYPQDNPSSDVFRFGAHDFSVHNQQLLATRGYAVLLPDTPCPPGKITDGLLTAVLPGVDEVGRLGLAAPNRAAVMGHSFGGYAALALAARTDRFKAVVASAPYADLFGLWGQAGPDGAAGGAAMLAVNHQLGPPWADPAGYLAESPAFRLDRVTAPVLLLHGALDETCPVAQSEAVFAGLRALGKRAEFARYAGEEHSPLTWAPANVRDYWTRVFGWLDAHLKGTP